MAKMTVGPFATNDRHSGLFQRINVCVKIRNFSPEDGISVEFITVKECRPYGKRWPRQFLTEIKMGVSENWIFQSEERIGSEKRLVSNNDHSNIANNL
jgi:hypothetical protein